MPAGMTNDTAIGGNPFRARHVPTIGVVLSGCGVFDRSEINEAVTILIAIDQLGGKAVCMAPDIARRSRRSTSPAHS